MRTANGIGLYSLLHVDDRHVTHANLDPAQKNPVDIYLRCGMTLAQSCKHSGMNYRIITNKKEFLASRLEVLGGDVDLVEQPFDRHVPQGIPFYSAHFKLDVFKAFGTGVYGSAVGLIDIDMVALHKLDITVPREDELFIYEISGQIRPAYGDAVVLRDLIRLGGPAAKQAYWYGGEFIIGSAGAFRRLSEMIDNIWPTYCAHWRELHHSGDEMIVTPALARLQNEGIRLIDAGANGTVARWWSVRTRHIQNTFSAAANANILHLPADKVFLAERSRHSFASDRFIEEYRANLSRRLWRYRLQNLVQSWKERQWQYVPQIR